MIIAVLVIGGKLFTNSLMHQDILDKQAVKNTELLKFSFIHQYEEFCDALEDDLRVRKVVDDIFQDFQKFYDDQREEDKIIYKKVENPKNLTKHKLEFFDANKLILFHPYIISISDQEKKVEWNKVEIPFEKLFINYKPYNFFNCIFLTDENGNVKWSNSEHFGSNLIDFKKIINIEKHTFSVTKGEILLDNEPYFIYFTQVEIDGLKFNLAGIISEANFKTVGFRLDHSLTTYLIFLLVLVLASIPIISVLSLRKGDILTKSKVYSCGLSLFAILLFLGGFTSMKLRDYNSEKVKLIQTQGEKICIDSAKKSYEKRILEINSKMSLPDPFNKYERDGLSKQIISIDSSGGWLKELKLDSPAKHIDTIPLGIIALSKRRYVNYFGNLPKDSTKYIGSHYSRLNGNLESVVSRKIGKEIIAIIFNLTNANKDTLLHSINSANRILIIKNDGKVVHKSEKVKSPIDSIQQFLSKEKWLQLKYLMENNSGQVELNDIFEIPLHLDGLDYRAYVSLIGKYSFDQPLWFIFFKNENPDEIKSTLISVESAIYFSLYILLLLVISIVTKIFKPAKPKYNWSSFSYGFLKPDGINENNYALLVIAFVLIGFTLSLLLINLNILGSFYIISMTLIFVSILIRTAITSDKSSSRPKEMNKYRTRNFIIVLILFGFAFSLGYFLVFSNGTHEKIFNFVFLFLLSSLVLLVLKLIKKKFDLQTLRIKISLNSIFALFLFSWFILIGFIPGLFIAEKTSDFEESVWERKKTENEQEDKLVWIDSFEGKRRDFFTYISTPFYEPEVKSFISPKKKLLQEAVVHSKNNLKLDFPSIFIILIILGLIYWLIYFLTRKIFFLDTSLQLLDKNFIKFNKKNENFYSNELKIFLCGVNTEICKEAIMVNFELTSEKFITIYDCILYPNLDFKISSKITHGMKEILLIQNIHCLKDQTILIEKLPTFITQAKENNIILIISSGISWKELVKSLPDGRSQIVFSEIFSSFYFDFVPIKSVPTIFKLEDLKNIKTQEKNIKTIPKGIFDEISVNEFLENNLDEKEKSLNFNLYVQRFGKAYFFNIWSELSFEEKKICYFYCREGLLNYANYDLVVELLQKGIFHINEKTKRIKIFSDGFRSFVLSQTSVEMLDEFNKDEKRNGNSMTIEIAIVSFIFIMLALISYFDKSFLNQTTTIVTGAAGLLGSLYSLIGRLFPSFQAK